MSKVVKFGGTSLADAAQIQKACDIVKSDPERRYMVVSAPGKRFPDDVKVTDLLIQLYDNAVSHKDTERLLNQIESRFQEIIDDLHIAFDLKSEMNLIRLSLKRPDREYLASRGEHLNAMIIAKYMNWPYVEAGDHVFFDEEHRFMAALSYASMAEALNSLEHAVIPGFYGRDRKHRIRVFSRGGSDITGAICARAVHASVYENWTDVNGMLSADPGIVKNPKRIEEVSYQELRELAYMGASVLHEDAVFPVRTAGIPIHILNTNHPEEPGTMIRPAHTSENRNHEITGIAGKKGLSNIQIDKAMMNTEIGFGAKVLEILAEHHVPYEHTPTSIDTMSVIVSTSDLENDRNEILAEINDRLKPDRVMIEDHIALVAVVGEGIARKTGFAAEVLKAIADAGINVRMIDVSFSELNVIIGVDERNYEKTIHAIYDAMTDRL